MQTLKRYLKIYFLIESQYIKARLQYRADFFISSIGMVITSITTIFMFWVLFDSIPDLAGWTFDELLFIYAFYLLAIVPLQIFFDHIWQLRWHVTDGTFIKYYFRPLNMMFYYMSEMFDVKGLSQLALGIVAMLYASHRLHIAWDVPRLALLFAAWLGSALVIISILVIASSLAFWMQNSFPVLNFAWKVREYAQYPMTIFDGLFRFVFTYLIPIGFVAFYPAQLFLRSGQAPLSAYASPLVGIAFFALAYLVWSKGVNHYSGTGS
jgi:ABC-2 type transport system permease protein